MSMLCYVSIHSTDLIPSLDLLDNSQVGVGQQVDVVSQLRHGGEDEDHRGEDHHSHRGEGVELKIWNEMD